MGVSGCGNKVEYCFGMFTDANPACGKWTTTGSIGAFQSGLDSKLFIGFIPCYLVEGQIGDDRFYFDSALSQQEMTRLFTQRKELSLSVCSVVTSPFDCTSCHGVYSTVTGLCEGRSGSQCATEGPSCVSDAARCAACSVCFYEQPFDSRICLPTCPTGYSPSSQKCVGTDRAIVELQFDVITASVDGGNGVKAGNGATAAYFPPSFEGTDPTPSSKRGYYFSGSQYLQLPPALNAAGDPALLPTSVTFSVWVRPQGTGVRTIFSKGENSNEIFTIQINAGNRIEFAGGFPRKSLTHPTVLMIDIWTFVVLTVQYDRSTGLTTVNCYFDGVLSSSISDSFYVKDSSALAYQNIGTSFRFSNSYIGFIWKLTIRNYVSPTAFSEIISNGCPAGLNFCLSVCPFSQTFDCQNCLNSCSNGCVRTTDCNLCLPACYTCTDFSSTSCTSCIPGAHFRSTGECACDSHWYVEPALSICSACSTACKECSSAGTDQCVECYDFARLVAAPPSACICSSDAYPAPDASNCKACSQACLTCVGDGPQACSSCKANAVLAGPAPNECGCAPSFYLNPDVLECSPCGAACQQCIDSNQCVQCQSNFTVQDGVCVCKEGFYQDSLNCNPCNTGCVSCIATGCQQCNGSLLLLSGACASACPAGYRRNNQSGCEVVGSSPPIATLVQSSDSELRILFDKPMDCVLTSSDISVAWSDPIFTDPQTASIALFFGAMSAAVPYEVTLTVISPSQVISKDGIAIAQSSLRTNYSPMHVPDASIGSIRNSTTAAQTSAATQGALVAGFAMSFMSGSTANLITSLNQFQLVCYIALSKLDLPTEFSAAIAALNTGLMLPNPLSSVLSVNETSQKATDRVAQYGIETTLVLPNICSLGTVSLLILLSYAPIWLLSKVSHKALATYFARQLPNYRWSVPLNIGFVLYLDIGIYALLQVTHISFASSYLGFNSVIAYCLLLFFYISPLALIRFAITNSGLISSQSDSTFNSRWKLFIDPFDPSKKFVGFVVYSLFLIRRCALSSLLILFPDAPGFFISSGIVLGSLVIATQIFLYIVFKQPFATSIDQFSNIAVETGTMAVYILAGIGAVCESWRNAVNTCGLWTIRVLVLLSAVIPVGKLVFTVTTAVKEYRDIVMKNQSIWLRMHSGAMRKLSIVSERTTKNRVNL